MPSIPSRSDRLPEYVLTRPAQRSPKSHLVPRAGATARVAALEESPHIPDDPSFFCINTVAAYGVILDFEASAIVVGTVRRFVTPKELEVTATLLFAEGAPVTIDRILDICRFAPSHSATDQVNRFIRNLRSLTSAIGIIEAVRGGYRLVVVRAESGP